MNAPVRLGIATDFNGDHGNMEPALSLLAEVFTRKNQPLPVLHYCQYQSTTGMITDRHIRDMLILCDRYGFEIADLHMSDGNYLWGTTYGPDRQTVRDVVRNRLEVLAALKTTRKVGVLHSPIPKDGDMDAFFRVVYEDMDLFAQWCEEFGVAIGLEQTNTLPQNWPYMKQFLQVARQKYRGKIGQCLDNGHCFLHGNTEELMVEYGDTINSVHLCSNQGPNQPYGVFTDMHLIPYHGSVPMDRDLALLAKSGYRGPLTMEITQRAYRPVHSMESYLEMACDNGMRMVRTFESLIAAA